LNFRQDLLRIVQILFIALIDLAKLILGKMMEVLFKSKFSVSKFRFLAKSCSWYSLIIEYDLRNSSNNFIEDSRGITF